MISAPEWLRSWPEPFAIVTGYFPERKPRGGAPACRPLLVTQLQRRKRDGALFLRVAHGTSNLRFPERADQDLIVQNLTDMNECGLMNPTRFVIAPQDQILLEWSEENFKPWGGCNTPRRGRLPGDLQRDYAWLMMKYLPQE